MCQNQTNALLFSCSVGFSEHCGANTSGNALPVNEFHLSFPELFKLSLQLNDSAFFWFWQTLASSTIPINSPAFLIPHVYCIEFVDVRANSYPPFDPTIPCVNSRTQSFSKWSIWKGRVFCASCRTSSGFIS